MAYGFWLLGFKPNVIVYVIRLLIFSLFPKRWVSTLLTILPRYSGF